MDYCFGGYYLIRINNLVNTTFKRKQIFTCSNCVNESLLNSWSYSWAETSEKELSEIKEMYKINDSVVSEIFDWTNNNSKNIGWPHVFLNIESILDYKNRFFKNIENVKIFGLYFPLSEIDKLINELEPKDNFGTLGVSDALKLHIFETPNINEIEIGYDLIGIDIGGGFNTFHCHNAEHEIVEMFSTEIYNNGLMRYFTNWQELVIYANDEQRSGFEPDIWAFCKVKEFCE